MKRLVLALLLLASIASCKKEDEKPSTNNNNTTPGYTCSSCIGSPEAKSQYDNSSAGVYKGIIVGSSGVVALYLYNTGTEVKMLVTFDGKNTTLSTTSLSAWAPGQAINAAVFTGTLDGQPVAATFSVGANGLNPVMTATIPGHTVTIAVYKETSTALVKNYEGTYEGSEQGTFNMTFHGNDYSIVTSGGSSAITGTLVNGAIDLAGNGVEIKGSFNNDDVTGTWKNTSKSTSGTWKGKRTM